MVYWDFWIFPLFCLGMMLFFMLTSKNSEHGNWGCMGRMDGSKEKDLEREILNLKEEIARLRK